MKVSYLTFATIAGPEGHRTATFVPSGRVKCQCGSILADRSQLGAHIRLETMLGAKP